uniref:Apple domain-containing protein n=1 Tax=Toxocara canis TaxID=6265 RepID=A0A183U5A7_TOXCA
LEGGNRPNALWKIDGILALANDSEANPFDADFSFDDVPIAMRTSKTADDTDRERVCVKGAEPSFIRSHHAFINGTPTSVTMVEMVTCADLCRDNVNPVNGERSECAGFNYFNTHSPSCEYFSQLTQVVICPNDVIMKNWVHKNECCC